MTAPPSKSPDTKSDIWSAAATAMEFLFDQPVWDFHAITKQLGLRDVEKALKEVGVVL